MGCSISSKKIKSKVLNEEESETCYKSNTKHLGSPFRETRENFTSLRSLNYKVQGVHYKIVVSFKATPNQSISAE
ncbi:unnamed protein product [Blepharisma stoltei]|uniref:Uncharacterized protein n=1 Tax=Blepharisma stoltei TaxID=1481888 RepID=A0AAU9IHY5_9CILI|nr:unnamed protein product [Blepharisma stoltei]